jgi:hypothetical protein
LIAAHRAHVPGDDGFRFRHLLIRDAAYDGLTKASRAELHQRYAAWLEQRSKDLVDLDEVLSYHLEQAARFKAELGAADPAVAGRAGERLAAAGRRALWRGDDRAAAALLARGLDLARTVGPDVHLELDLAAALHWVDTLKAAEVAEEAAERAHATGDGTGEALARVLAAFHRGTITDAPAVDEIEALARVALPLLNDAGDDAGLADVWHALSLGVALARGRFEDMAHASEQALRHARTAGRRDSTLFHLPVALLSGPRPADEALRTLDLVLSAERAHPNPQPLLIRANLVAMLGRFDEAWSIPREASDRLWELRGLGVRICWPRSPRLPATTRPLPATSDGCATSCKSVASVGTSPALRRPLAGPWLRSDDTTRPSRSLDSGVTLRGSKTSRRKHSGGRCRPSSRPSGANTPRPRRSRVRRSQLLRSRTR